MLHDVVSARELALRDVAPAIQLCATSRPPEEEGGGGEGVISSICLSLPELGYRDVTKREAREFVEFLKMAPSPFASTTFSSWFSYLFKLQAVFGKKSVIVMFLSAEVSEFSLQLKNHP